MPQSARSDKAALGVAGLDDVLVGGLTRGHLYLLEGSPGTGKTTIALQFLVEGHKRGEKGLYVTLSETDDELRLTAKSHGWEIGETFDIFEQAPPESLLDSDQEQTLLYSSDLELGEATKTIFAAVERAKPDRIVLDSLSEIRLLAQSSLRYRRQILLLKHYFSRNGATVLMLDDLTSDANDKTVHSLAHGVIRLDELAPTYGAERRRLRVTKYRGQAYRGGYHDFAIKHGGVEVFPRLIAAEHRTSFDRSPLTSNIGELDDLLGGGLDAGSSALVLGPAGAGKSLLTLHFARAAVERGEKAALFIFDEELGLLFKRAKSMGIDLEELTASGNLFIEQVDAAELSPGEFAHLVRKCVDTQQVKTVVIDSLNGYQAAMPEENSLLLHMHELLQYLNRQGASTFVTVAQHGLVGETKSPVDMTYLADSVILLRYFEAAGRVRRAISIIKKRTGPHEDTIREYRIGSTGFSIGEPLEDFQGVLRGIPTYTGSSNPLLGTGPDGRFGPSSVERVE
ncbi:ATPase domain-containing protein [Devosia psychrophila]|jgi:circadian clock protein KaiC|uniref:non-specific serine/threonine protein kinase n=1 Tax=Devosia psychrophila TaxID=728005 RepID=A0A0F5PRS2_9HYPH|nr:ATPase domain-containing protein [Devosia psychrophila]KKC31076.1 circadian clock protein KaiC [Devosia psychrophila]SFD14555.1 circadian clock protein KaiC [Devosia psychrophila]